MNKKGVKQFVEQAIDEFLATNGFELYDVDFVKEGRDYFLRVQIDKLPNESGEQYISTDDCELVSRYLSDILDAEDPIEQNYYLEVSSPGMDRELKRDKDFEKYAGQSVDVKLYQKIDNQKEITATLVSKDDDYLNLENNGVEIKIPMKDIAKVNLTVIF